jgi:hypothetical protein
MKPRKRRAYYEHNPIHAGSHWMLIKVKQQGVGEGYEHDGTQRYINYLAQEIIGVIEQTEPFDSAPQKSRPQREKEFPTLAEAEAFGDAIEAEYDQRGWYEYDRYSVELQ